MYRKLPLATGGVYHVFNKSIAGYNIFNRPSDYEYMRRAIRYFMLRTPPNKFSFFLKKDIVVKRDGFEKAVSDLVDREGSSIQLIAYCLMPTHFHLLIRQIEDNGISEFLRKSLNTYARYFNTKYERSGPLWTGPFKNVPVENNEQLLHLTRYIHLNPVTAMLVNKPEAWPYSSYMEYVDCDSVPYILTRYDGLISVTGKEYGTFCEDQIDYQRELAAIKHQMIE